MDDIRLIGASTVEQAVRSFGGNVDQFERNLRYFDEIVSRFERAIQLQADNVARIEALCKRE